MAEQNGRAFAAEGANEAQYSSDIEANATQEMPWQTGLISTKLSILSNYFFFNFESKKDFFILVVR